MYNLFLRNENGNWILVDNLDIEGVRDICKTYPDLVMHELALTDSDVTYSKDGTRHLRGMKFLNEDGHVFDARRLVSKKDAEAYKNERKMLAGWGVTYTPKLSLHTFAWSNGYCDWVSGQIKEYVKPDNTLTPSQPEQMYHWAYRKVKHSRPIYGDYRHSDKDDDWGEEDEVSYPNVTGKPYKAKGYVKNRRIGLSWKDYSRKSHQYDKKTDAFICPQRSLRYVKYQYATAEA